MKTRLITPALAVLAAIALVAVACGGDDGDSDAAAIRIDKGLDVAALVSANIGSDDGLVGGASDGAEREAPVPAADFNSGTALEVAPDVAPFGFPLQEQSLSGLTVQGFGSATADADTAALWLYFGTSFEFDERPLIEPGFPEPDIDFEERSSESGSGSDGSAGTNVVEVAPQPVPAPEFQEVDPITEADLQPIVDAIVSQGVSRDDIEIQIDQYYDMYYSSASIIVTVDDVDSTNAIVEAAAAATGDTADIDFQGNSVSYSVGDCAALELAALEAAVDDAGERGDVFAQALGVGLGEILGASNYSYGACGDGVGGPYPMERYDDFGSGTPEVQVVTAVTITYAIQ
jgi:uncharacterized protein YggE